MIEQKRSIYEVARRYSACIHALSDILGIPPYVLLTKHHAAIATVFLEVSKNGIRLDGGVQLAPIYHILSQ